MLGPIMMMRPSKRDAKEAELRLKALSHGLKVTMERHPDTDNTDMYAVYYLSWPSQIMKAYSDQLDWSITLNGFEHGIHFHKRWDWVEGREAPAAWSQAIKSCLDSLSKDEVALSSSRAGLAIYWNESLRGRTTDEAVHHISELLKALSKECR